ncbi:hypothetical protein JTB14_024783 [Gonioctena quinquepunctata]|nr:hypothetical protein JTB14_024783 [Gonioctena quinquepunctata]
MYKVPGSLVHTPPASQGTSGAFSFETESELLVQDLSVLTAVRRASATLLDLYYGTKEPELRLRYLSVLPMIRRAGASFLDLS